MNVQKTFARHVGIYSEYLPSKKDYLSPSSLILVRLDFLQGE